jgi:hypothetical protein
LFCAYLRALYGDYDRKAPNVRMTDDELEGIRQEEWPNRDIIPAYVCKAEENHVAPQRG